MNSKIPNFKYRLNSPVIKSFGIIELDNVLIHKVTNHSEFYACLGYHSDLAKQGILPEEFVWETYFRHSNRTCNSCYQLNIINYLLKNSPSFAKQYFAECEEWIATLTERIALCNVEVCAVKK